MAGAAGPGLVAAICNAGGYGVIPLWGKSSEQVSVGIEELIALTGFVDGVDAPPDGINKAPASTRQCWRRRTGNAQKSKNWAGIPPSWCQLSGEIQFRQAKRPTP